MQDEHIVDGDYVLVEKTKIASNGGNCGRPRRRVRRYFEAHI